VVAVHGNDDSAGAKRELPTQQVLTVGGRRILLWHSHYPDRQVELASRKDDGWASKLARSAQRAQRAGAEVVVYGHTHVPMTRMVDGVHLVNPGAIASGNYVTRQTRQTVALMTLRDGSPVEVRHVDLAAPGKVYEARVDWDAGFVAAMARYQESILAPELRGAFAGLRPEDFEDVKAFVQTVLPLAHECWAGKRQWISADALWDAIEGKIGEEDWGMLKGRAG
jgi:putative phosphoesterase